MNSKSQQLSIENTMFTLSKTAYNYDLRCVCWIILSCFFFFC